MGWTGILKFTEPSGSWVDIGGNPVSGYLFVLMRFHCGFASPNFVAESLFCQCGRLAWEWAAVKKLQGSWRLIKLVLPAMGLPPRMTGKFVHLVLVCSNSLPELKLKKFEHIHWGQVCPLRSQIAFIVLSMGRICNARASMAFVHPD